MVAVVVIAVAFPACVLGFYSPVVRPHPTAAVGVNCRLYSGRATSYFSRSALTLNSKAIKEETKVENEDSMKEGGGDPRVVLYNTACQRKEKLKPLTPKRIKFYSCGPTVYDTPHIGNWRAQLTYDVLKRWLEYCGYNVDHVCNLTDVDDKIISRMKRDGRRLDELTNEYSGLFFKGMKDLNIRPASIYPRASQHIQEVVEMVQGLIAKGLAYEQNGSYYFSVSSTPTYGSLGRLKLSGMQDGGSGRRLHTNEVTGKENAKDFALWKAYKQEDGDVFWSTSLGKGRPGWHIECSAMAQKYLGDTMDIHAGGLDLSFPHHENEMAQSEGYTGKDFCNCWVHNGFLNVKNEKMGKSKGNILTLSDICSTQLDIRAFRYLVCSSHYRSSLNYSPNVLSAAKMVVKRLDRARNILRNAAESNNNGDDRGPSSTMNNNTCGEAAYESLRLFEEGMSDDLNAPRASSGLFHLVKAAEKAEKSGVLSEMGGAQSMLDALHRMDLVFGIFYEPLNFKLGNNNRLSTMKDDEIPSEVVTLMKQRQVARKAKDWIAADNARDKISRMGYTLVDVKGGGGDDAATQIIR